MGEEADVAALSIEERLAALEQKSSGWIPFWESPWARETSLTIVSEALSNHATYSDTKLEIHEALLVELLQRAFSYRQLRGLLDKHPRLPTPPFNGPQWADVVGAAIETYPPWRGWKRRLIGAGQFGLGIVVTVGVILLLAMCQGR